MNYRKLVKFTYKNGNYQLLMDDNNKYFFMKINDNNDLTYVTLEEYLNFLQIFCTKPHAMMIVGDKKSEKKIKIIPKIIIGGTTTLLTLTTLAVINQARVDAIMEKRLAAYYSTHSEEGVIAGEVQEHVSFLVEDKEEELVVDTTLYNDISNTYYVYDLKYLDDFFDYDSVSYDEMISVLNSNKKISDNFRPLLIEYIDNLYEKYPDVDKRVLYENLKTLEIIECKKEELTAKTLSFESNACYISSENKIYTLDNYKYEKGTWDYQVIFHEVSHALRTATIKKDDKTIQIRGGGNSLPLTTVDEALNSVFAVSLFDYEERDIAYQLQSNYCKIMVECLDNYTLGDYVNHSLSYYAKKLDEQNGDNNYASVILNLIDTQYNDFHSEDIQIDQEEYYPIYDYICDMYYTKYITSDMSYSEAKKVADTLVDEVMFDVPEEYNIDTNRFYHCLDMYCELVGIQVNTNNKTM